MDLSFQALKSSYTKYLKSPIRPEWKTRIEATADQIASHRERYEALSAKTNIPWYVIGIIHHLEADCDFNTYLGDGEPLNRKTRNVPKGRGPFKMWEEGAIDALKLEHALSITDWSDEATCYFFEGYNGFGYRYHGVPSPYLMSGTQAYTRGLFDVDDHYAARLKSRQVGAVPLLNILKNKEK